jgi:hypothetical protein
VYLARGEESPKVLAVADTRIAGFVGLAQKGPLDEPLRIASWDEFVDTYGTSDVGFLARAVEGFFLNGGKACWVVRVAHRARGEKPVAGPEHAACAERVIPDAWNKPAIRVRAQSEGKWGNNIWVRFGHSTGSRALLTHDLDVGAGEAQVNLSRGFERGALVRIYDREGSDYVVLSEVKERTIRWSSATPVNRRYRAAGPTYVEVLEFELHVALRDRRETFKNLQLHPSSRRYASRVLAEESRLVYVEDMKSTSPLPHNLPRAEPAAKLTSGRDGTDTVTTEDFIGHDAGPEDRAGLMALMSLDEPSLISVPDATIFIQRKPGPEGEMATQRIQDQMVIQSELRKDRIAILDCPPTRDPEVVKRWRRRTDSSYAVFYWPWLGVLGPDGQVVKVPPSGHMAGMFARCDTEVGVHRAPANEQLRGVVALSVPVTEDDQGSLNAEGVNCFRLARGIRPWGVRTASSDPDWRYVNVRRLFIMLRRSLEAGSAWVCFEPNDKRTWKSMEDMTKSFLQGLYEKGMFTGGSPAEAFYVKCDDETNPPDVRDQGLLVCEVGVAPVVPAEFIVIKVTQRLGDETAKD